MTFITLKFGPSKACILNRFGLIGEVWQLLLHEHGPRIGAQLIFIFQMPRFPPVVDMV